MCYNCGCANPHDDMGDSNNITEDTLKHLSEDWNRSLLETKSEVLKMLQDNTVEDPHLIEMFEKAARAWGQSIEEAKKNTMSLLKKEVDRQH